jgi:hypothetical protein
VKYELKSLFLKELYQKIRINQVPVMVGGDFNMIRYVHEKSSRSDSTIWMDIFNYFINDIAMIEVFRGGGGADLLGLTSKITLLEVIWTKS